MCGTIEHTFVVCAYKQSEYLEDCIISLKANNSFKYNSMHINA